MENSRNAYRVAIGEISCHLRSISQKKKKKKKEKERNKRRIAIHRRKAKTIADIPEKITDQY